MPMMVPYGMPPPMQGMAGPFRVHVAGGHHPGAPAPAPNAGVNIDPAVQAVAVPYVCHIIKAF